MINTEFDLVIIGSGPGGYVAAIRAAQLKLKVVVVENKELGGVCLNWGCIPTKSLLRTSEIYEYLKNSENFGLNVKDASFNTSLVVKRSRKIAKKLSDGISYLFKKNKIELLNGEAKINKDKNVSVKDKNGNYKILNTKRIIIATGASPKKIDFIKSDSRIWNYMDAMIPNNIPKKLGIIGSGAIGIEFACFYKSLGAEVSVFEIKSAILPNEDQDISKALEEVLVRKGIKFHKNTQVSEVRNEKQIILKSVNLSNGKESLSEFDNLLVAVGVEANTSKLGLEFTSVKLKNHNIITHEYGKTDDDKILAIGDVAGGPWLAHKASHEGIICVENIAGLRKNQKCIMPSQVPSCVYSHPQVASIGLTEKAAKEKTPNIRIGKFPLSANGKALSLSESDGFVKTIFDGNTGEILGAHLIGTEVTEIINSFALAMKLEATEEDILETIFPHPTISESIHESVLNAFDKSIHI